MCVPVASELHDRRHREPEPCIESITPTATGYDVVVLAVHLSDYNFSDAADSTAPEIDITRPAEGARYLLGSHVTASYDCFDPELAPARAAAPWRTGRRLPTGVAAPRQPHVHGDRRERRRQLVESNDYSVVLGFGGFRSPVDPRPTLNVVKAGAAVPVRFALTDHAGTSAYALLGLDVFAAGFRARPRSICGTRDDLDPLEETSTASTSGLVYEAGAGLYRYNWKTDKAWSAG